MPCATPLLSSAICRYGMRWCILSLITCACLIVLRDGTASLQVHGWDGSISGAPFEMNEMPCLVVLWDGAAGLQVHSSADVCFALLWLFLLFHFARICSHLSSGLVLRLATKQLKET